MHHIDFNFTLEAQDSKTAARAGFFQTAHAKTLTPVFMPVATHAALRGIETPKLLELGFNTLLANTYHLLLKPGQKVFEHFGGIHKFMNWPYSILTDSGGFQIFSMSEHLKISEEGARFRSYVDGKYINLTPELSIQMQAAINSDIMMVLDQCIPSLSSKEQALEALELTYRWAKRSFNARTSKQALFGIVQGACFSDLRSLSAEQICSIDFDGFAIGGVAVGEEKNKRDDIVAHTALLLPKHKPRYVMGIGTPQDLLAAIRSGVDMFDCILPAALGQQGVAFTSEGKIDLRKGIYKFQESSLDSDCSCNTCKNYSAAYLHHLVKCNEFIGGSLIAFHNLYFYKNLINQARSAIFEDRYNQFYNQKIEELNSNRSDKTSSTLSKTSHKTSDTDLSELGDYQLIQNYGHYSIQQKSSSEIMHSVIDPDKEALELYIEQSNLEQKLAQRHLLNPEKDFVIWDVGLGAAHNAMAAIRKCLGIRKTISADIKIHIISFENDLDSLKLALLNKNKFKHLLHKAPVSLLKNNFWKDKELYWQLIEGDFCQLFSSQPEPDLIFFDPFSYKTNSEFWSYSLLKSLYQKCKSDQTELYTYSASTAFRAALLMAGFCVAKGVASGPKSDTTIGLKLSSLSQKPDLDFLDQNWLNRWDRSDNKVPSDLMDQSTEELKFKLSEHPQFKAQVLSEKSKSHP